MLKALTLKAQTVPITVDPLGKARVGDSRIPLERVIDAYNAGERPESICEAFDTLQLADVYAVIWYYLDHRDEVEEYLRQQQHGAAAIRQQIEAAQGGKGPSRAELQARLDQRNGNAAAGH
jgi:uncharacterized protein (DUF433 family)